jgi:DNA-binding CsgD family transcriptional regulator
LPKRSDGSDAQVPAPPRARASSFELGGAAYAVISFPLASLPTASTATLTDAERAVAAEIVAGASYQAIAAARGTSLRTVRNQATSIFKKLGVASRVDLVARAGRSSEP